MEKWLEREDKRLLDQLLPRRKIWGLVDYRRLFIWCLFSYVQRSEILQEFFFILFSIGKRYDNRNRTFVFFLRFSPDLVKPKKFESCQQNTAHLTNYRIFFLFFFLSLFIYNIWSPCWIKVAHVLSTFFFWYLFPQLMSVCECVLDLHSLRYWDGLTCVCRPYLHGWSNYRSTDTPLLAWADFLDSVVSCADRSICWSSNTWVKSTLTAECWYDACPSWSQHHKYLVVQNHKRGGGPLFCPSLCVDDNNNSLELIKSRWILQVYKWKTRRAYSLLVLAASPRGKGGVHARVDVYFLMESATTEW